MTTTAGALRIAAEAGTAGTPLDAARHWHEAAQAAEVSLLLAVVEHAIAHPPADAADECRVAVSRSVEGRVTTVPLNADGAPPVSALAVAQLGATLGISTAASTTLVGEALELAFRLPHLYARVREGSVPLWRARRVARATQGLNPEAARFVDQHVQSVAGSIGVRALDALANEAVNRYDHDRAAQRIAREVDARAMVVQLDECDLLGLVPVRGLVDLPDALALDAALAHGADRLAAWGATDGRDARRARAAGDLARGYLSGEAQPDPPTRAVWDDETNTLTPLLLPSHRSESPVPTLTLDAAEMARPAAAERRDRPSHGRAYRREVLLHVHVTDRDLIAALRAGVPARAETEGLLLGRAEHARTGDLPIATAVLRSWCGDPNTSLRVQPVIDLDRRIHHDGYEIPDRLREQVIGRDHTCVYPFCSTPARACDLDHIVPFDRASPRDGGQTATDNLAPFCRRHHNLKTQGPIRYTMTAPGTFEWDLGIGRTFLRDHTGTHNAGWRASHDPRQLRPEP